MLVKENFLVVWVGWVKGALQVVNEGVYVALLVVSAKGVVACGLVAPGEREG